MLSLEVPGDDDFPLMIPFYGSLIPVMKLELNAACCVVWAPTSLGCRPFQRSLLHGTAA